MDERRRKMAKNGGYLKVDWETKNIEKRYGLTRPDGISDRQTNYARIVRARFAKYLEAVVNEYAIVQKCFDELLAGKDARWWLDRKDEFADIVDELRAGGLTEGK